MERGKEGAQGRKARQGERYKHSELSGVVRIGGGGGGFGLRVSCNNVKLLDDVNCTPCNIFGVQSWFFDDRFLTTK